MIVQNEKMPFQATKTGTSKSRKIDIFPNGLTHGFGPKVAIFPTFFLRNIAQENIFYDCLERQNAFLSYKNKKFKKSKIDIFPNGSTHGFGPKMTIFQLSLFWAIQATKFSFTIFQNQKTPFQATTTKSSNRRKIDIFPKGLTHRCGLKWPFFQLFFLGNTNKENVFYDILECKNASLGYKNKKFKKSKN